jgi:hypothetical protein
MRWQDVSEPDIIKKSWQDMLHFAHGHRPKFFKRHLIRNRWHAVVGL